MKTKYYCFKKYDERKRRLAIRGVLTPDRDRVAIKIITCSRSDQFSKRFAREAFVGKHEVTPIFTIIEVKDNKPGKSFIDWCNENFYDKVETYRAVPYAKYYKKHDKNRLFL